MRLFAISVLTVCLSLTAISDEPAGTESENRGKPTSFWMQKKMEYAQEILRGLASADYEAIGASARQMRTLNKVEGFVRSRDANYRIQLHTFERVCNDMVHQADKENLPGVTLAFNQLTVSCVSCHQSLRVPANGVSEAPDVQGGVDVGR